MNRICIAIFAILLTGCTGSTTPPPAVSADRAALVLTVKAEPKQGWKAESGDAYSGRTMGGVQFDTVDYSDLSDVVVWVRPTAPANPVAQQKRIDIGTSSSQLTAACLRDALLLRNVGPEPRTLYLRTESGRVSDLGTIPQSGGQTRVELNEAGFHAIVDGATERVVTQFYVAPFQSTWPDAIRSTHSDKKLTFNDLPPGPAEVGSWHPRLPGQTRTVTLEAGKATPATISVGVNSLPKVR